MFVKRGDYSAFSKSNVTGEKTFRQRKFDQKRMDQLTTSLLSMRKKEKRRDFAGGGAGGVEDAGSAVDNQ